MRTLFALAALLVFPASAHAELASLFGIGAKSMGMGGVSLAEGEANPFQVYSAPGALGFLRRVEIDFGAVYLQPNIMPYGTVSPGPTGQPLTFNDAGVLPGGGSLLGFAIPIGKTRPLVIGGTIFLPFSSLIRVSGTPVDYPFYPLYTDISRNFFFTVGAGYELIDGLGLGINFRSTTNSVTSYVLRSDSSVNYSASATEAKSTSRLSVSAVYDNARRHPGGAPWSGGLMYRGYSGMQTKISADITAFVPVQGTLVNQPSFTPAEWAAMGSWKPMEGWTVSADIARVLWSAYTSPYGGGNINSYVINGDAAAANFHDVWVPRLGLEQEKPLAGATVKKLYFREGYLYYPSPVPDQTGDSNFVDNSRHMFTAGAGAGFQNPWKDDDLIDLDLFFQYNLLAKRQISKLASTNVGAPGYLTGGDILMLGAGVGLKF